jgi:hypothetical protein
MRAIRYLKNRFEFAAKNGKPLYINQNDVDALNQIIEFANGKPKSTELEDSLMLFYILQYWKVENKENQKLVATENKQGIFEITGADIILKKLSMMLEPKSWIIKQIRDELRVHQAMNGIPKNERIPTKAVAELLDEILEIAKNNFPLARELNEYEVRYVDRADKTK